jgi:hypothetical protein
MFRPRCAGNAAPAPPEMGLGNGAQGPLGRATALRPRRRPDTNERGHSTSVGHAEGGAPALTDSATLARSRDGAGNADPAPPAMGLGNGAQGPLGHATALRPRGRRTRTKGGHSTSVGHAEGGAPTLTDSATLARPRDGAGNAEPAPARNGPGKRRAGAAWPRNRSAPEAAPDTNERGHSTSVGHAEGGAPALTDSATLARPRDGAGNADPAPPAMGLGNGAQGPLGHATALRPRRRRTRTKGVTARASVTTAAGCGLLGAEQNAAGPTLKGCG